DQGQRRLQGRGGRHAGLPGPRQRGCACSWRPLLKLGASGELHLEGRALTQGRFDPDAATVHLNDLLGNCETETSAALGLGVGAVDLMELLEDARSLINGDAWPRIGYADVEVAVDRLGTHAHLSGVGELDGITDEIEQHLGEALLVAKPYGQGLGHLGREREL